MEVCGFKLNQERAMYLSFMFIFVVMGFESRVKEGLELFSRPVSDQDTLTSVSQATGIIDMHHHTQLYYVV
jgi:hypothetical protein